MYRLDTCQVRIMHLAPTAGSAEIKRGVVLFATDGEKCVNSHLITSNSSNSGFSYPYSTKQKPVRTLFWRTQVPCNFQTCCFLNYNSLLCNEYCNDFNNNKNKTENPYISRKCRDFFIYHFSSQVLEMKNTRQKKSSNLQN